MRLVPRLIVLSLRLSQEVVTRRYKDLTPESLPDLLVIDGGKGQLTSVQDALDVVDAVLIFGRFSIFEHDYR